MNPQCAFSDYELGSAQTTLPVSGRLSFDYSATSLACPGFGGYCQDARVLAVTPGCDCPVESASAGPDCHYVEDVFNHGAPYFSGAGPQSVAGSWTFDLLAGDCVKLAAVTGGFNLDCQVLATFSNLVFTPALSTTQDQVSVGAGGTAGLELRVSPDFAAAPYLILGSATGTDPGFLIDGKVLPLNVDAYLLFTLGSPNTPPLGNSLGLVDATGSAAASFTLPPGSSPSLVGFQVDHAAIVFDTSPGTASIVGMVTNAAALQLVP